MQQPNDTPGVFKAPGISLVRPTDMRFLGIPDRKPVTVAFVWLAASLMSS